MKAALLACAFAALSVGASAVAQDEPAAFDEALPPELIGPPPHVTATFVDAPLLRAQVWAGQWVVELTTDQTGVVTEARIKSGPETQRVQVIATARTLRFEPRVVDSRPRPAHFDFYIEARRADYSGPEGRSFPDAADLSNVRIRLERSACLGSCPAYSIEIRGNGDVIYRGEGAVLIAGEHHWRVPQANVEELLRLMRAADYFRLQGYYEINATDLPNYITGLDIGDQHKFVLDYGGSGMGEAVASTIMGPSEGPAMPRAVTEIEEAIDRLSGAVSYKDGDEHTMDRLRAEHFHFRSQQGGIALAQALSDCQMSLARALLAEQAPVEVRVGSRTEAAIPLAARCGDASLINELIAHDALRRQAAAVAFLSAASAAGYPELVRIALQHSRALNQGEVEERPLWLSVEAMDPAEIDRPERAAGFDRAAVVQQLLAAGADARMRDALMGWTLLHINNDAGVARLLLAAGADPNARDENGRTALFGAYDPTTAHVLIEAGTDVRVRDSSGQTALFEAGSADMVRVLLAAGLSFNDVNTQGKTPIETVQGGEEAVIALMDAGARLPDDPACLRAFLQRARASQWATVTPLAERHARELGVAEN